MKPTALVMIGCPSSGKSTVASDLVESKGYVQIERDLVREELAGTRKEFYTKFPRKVGEAAVSSIIRQNLMSAAKQNQNVVISDTNINRGLRHRLYRDLFDLGFSVEVQLFDVDLQTLFDRNDERPTEEQVPEDIINRMYTDLQKQFDLLCQEVSVLNFRYQRPVIVTGITVVYDIDGTLAERSDRSPFEWNRVNEDKPRESVIELMDYDAQDLAPDSFITVFSGRDSVCREMTFDWLENNTGYHDDVDYLDMREEGNTDPDWIVKGKMLIEFTINKPHIHVLRVVDDRQQVVDIWSNMGLEVWQVQQNKF